MPLILITIQMRMLRLREVLMPCTEPSLSLFRAHVLSWSSNHNSKHWFCAWCVPSTVQRIPKSWQVILPDQASPRHPLSWTHTECVPGFPKSSPTWYLALKHKYWMNELKKSHFFVERCCTWGSNAGPHGELQCRKRPKIGCFLHLTAIICL